MTLDALSTRLAPLRNPGARRAVLAILVALTLVGCGFGYGYGLLFDVVDQYYDTAGFDRDVAVDFAQKVLGSAGIP